MRIMPTGVRNLMPCARHCTHIYALNSVNPFFSFLKFPVGNVYEMGKLNMLTIIQLLTKALELLLRERRHHDKKAFKVDLQDLEGITRFQNETLLGLKSLR